MEVSNFFSACRKTIFIVLLFLIVILSPKNAKAIFTPLLVIEKISLLPVPSLSRKNRMCSATHITRRPIKKQVPVSGIQTSDGSQISCISERNCPLCLFQTLSTVWRMTTAPRLTPGHKYSTAVSLLYSSPSIEQNTVLAVSTSIKRHIQYS